MPLTRLTVADEKKITKLYGEGHTYTEIARRIHCHPGTVAKHAKRLGLSGNHTSALQPSISRAPAVSPRQQRGEIAQRLLQEAVRMLDAIGEPYVAYAFGGKDFTYVEHVVETLPRDKADLARAAVLLLDEHRKLTEFDAEDGAAAARSVLALLGQAIGISAVQLEGGRVAGEILAGTAEDV
jgi:helix-turn-helix protein